MRDTVEGGPASRLMRWILKLSEYDFEVEHKPGQHHKDADGVSRLVAPAITRPQSHARATARSRQKAERIERSQRDVSTSYLDVGAPSTAALRRAQLDDPECQEIRHYLAGELRHIDSPQDLKRIARLVKITSDKGGDGEPSQRRIVDEDGILYRLAGSTQHDQRRLPYVPLGLRIPIIAAFHDHMGHLSRDRTAAAIRSRYFWPGLTEDVWEYVAECHECTLAKPGRAVSRKPRGPTLGRYPFDLLYTDVLSMEESYDYDKEKGTGASKLLVFADSLSRWVEAIPLHKDPLRADPRPVHGARGVPLRRAATHPV